MNLFSCKALSAALLAPLALSLAAQTPVAKPLDLSAELDEIVNTDQIGAASKHVQDLASAPADVVVLRSSELKALGYRTLGDALGGILGFRTNEDHAYQGMGAAGVYMLGDQNTRLLVLLDGHALNSPSEVGSSKVGEDFGFPLELVDHIEVVRGPASSLYGNNAFQALVNVVSAAAAGEAGNPFRAAVTTGTDGLSELWVQQGIKINGVSASLMLSGFQRTGTAQTLPELQPETIPAALDREERQSAYLYVKGSEWSLAATLLSRTQRLASAPYGSVPGDPGNDYRNRRLSGEFKWEPHTDAVHWMFRAFGDRNEFLDALRPDGGSRTFDADPDRSLGVEAQGRASLGAHFTLTFGTEQQVHRYHGLYTAPDDGTRLLTEVNYAVGNTYLEGNWQPSAQWNVVAGLQRADWRPSLIRNILDGSVQNLERSSISRLTPRLSVIWKANGGDVLKFIYGQGFRFPTIFERYYTDTQTQVPNTGLKPEIITSQQVSWSRKWNPQWSTHVAVSFFRGEEAIQPGTSAQDGMEQYQNAQSPSQGRVVEWETAWHRGGLELSGGAGWYDWTRQGLTLPNASRWNGVFKAIQHAGNWSLAGEARYVAGRENPDTPTGIPTRVPANWTLRTSLRRETSWGWGQVSIEDLTNSRRRDLVAPEYQPVTWMAADGRSVRATLGVRF